MEADTHLDRQTATLAIFCGDPPSMRLKRALGDGQAKSIPARRVRLENAIRAPAAHFPPRAGRVRAEYGGTPFPDFSDGTGRTKL